MSLTDFESRVQAMNRMDPYAHLRAFEIDWGSVQKQVREKQEEQARFVALFRDQSK